QKAIEWTASRHAWQNEIRSAYRSSLWGEIAFFAHSQALCERGQSENVRPAGAKSSNANAPMVYTIVRSSMAAPFWNSSGAMNRVEPHILPTGFAKGILW